MKKRGVLVRVVHGIEEDLEMTYVEIYSLREILEKNLSDWSTLGMISLVLMEIYKN